MEDNQGKPAKEGGPGSENSGKKLRWGKEFADDDSPKSVSTGASGNNSRRSSNQTDSVEHRAKKSVVLNHSSLTASPSSTPRKVSKHTQDLNHASPATAAAKKKGAEWKANTRRSSTDINAVNGKNNVADGKRKDSLTVPGAVGRDNLLMDIMGSRENVSASAAGLGTSDAGSRRSSVRSLESRLSGVDMSKFVDSAANGNGNDESEPDHAHAPGAESYIRSVIPFLPRWMAALCLLLNTFTPGLGTILSGVVVFCGVGKTRVQSKDDSRGSTMCVNAMVGLMQVFTVSFMLVGWFWSFVWGIYMVILAVEYHKKEKEKHDKELQAKALTALNSNIRPWSLV